MKKDVLYPTTTFSVIGLVLFLTSTTNAQQVRQYEHLMLTEQRKIEELSGQQNMEYLIAVALANASSTGKVTVATGTSQYITAATASANNIEVSVPDRPITIAEIQMGAEAQATTPAPTVTQDTTKPAVADQFAEQMAAQKRAAEQAANDRAAAEEAARIAAEQAAIEAAKLAQQNEKSSRTTSAS